MKIKYFNWLIKTILFISCLVILASNTVFAGDEKEIVQHSNTFSFKLFNEITNGNGLDNIVVSPFSASTALSLVLNQATGATRDAMHSTLDYQEMEMQSINEEMKFVLDNLQHNDSLFTLNIANSVWDNAKYSTDNKFLSKVQDYYQAECNLIDFESSNPVASINRWVLRRTNRKIERIIELLDPELKRVVINTIYFLGKWEKPFVAKNTNPMDFYLMNSSNESVPMMRQKNIFKYYETDDFQVIAMQYKATFEMVVLLPTEKEGITTFLKWLNYSQWKKIQRNFVQKEGVVHLPRFKTDYSRILNSDLTNLGMGIAFDPVNATFFDEGVNQNLYINQILQKSMIEVDEQGTEAAAVTVHSQAVTTANYPPPEKPFQFIADHPFCFAIVNTENDLILFMGVIFNPLQ